MAVLVWLLACRSYGIYLIAFPPMWHRFPHHWKGGLEVGQTAWIALGARLLGLEI